MTGRIRDETATRIIRGPDKPTWVKPPPKPRVDVDWDAVRKLRDAPVDGHAYPITGRCRGEDCGRPITGERRFCGRCAAARDAHS